MPRRREARPAGGARTARSRSARRVGDGDGPVGVVVETHGDVTVGVDHGRRVAAQERQGPIGDPALAHTVEIERHRLGAPEQLATPRSLQPPRADNDRSLVASFGSQARLQQRDIDEATGQRREVVGAPEQRSQRGAHSDRVERPGSVQSGQLGALIEAGQATRPRLDTARHEPQVPLRHPLRATGARDAQADDPAHGPEGMTRSTSSSGAASADATRVLLIPTAVCASRPCEAQPVRPAGSPEWRDGSRRAAWVRLRE